MLQKKSLLKQNNYITQTVSTVSQPLGKMNDGISEKTAENFQVAFQCVHQSNGVVMDDPLWITRPTTGPTAWVVRAMSAIR